MVTTKYTSLCTSSNHGSTSPWYPFLLPHLQVFRPTVYVSVFQLCAWQFSLSCYKFSSSSEGCKSLDIYTWQLAQFLPFALDLQRHSTAARDSVDGKVHWESSKVKWSKVNWRQFKSTNSGYSGATTSGSGLAVVVSVGWWLFTLSSYLHSCL